KKWQSMSSAARSRSQPEGRSRTKPGRGGGGDYYHVAVRPKEDFVTFRTQDVGDPGPIQRVAGQRPSGSWGTGKWLVSKDDAHREDGKLIADSSDVKSLFAKLGSKPRHVKADLFEAKPRPNVPERKKPTEAQKAARRKNIRKAQAARRGKS